MTKVYRVQLTFDRFDILADLTLAWEGIYTRPDADEEWEATPYHSRDIHLGEEQDPEGPSRVAEMVDLVIDSMGINYYLEPLDRDEVAVDGQTGEDADIDDDKLRKYRNGLIRSITEGQMMRPCKFSFDQEDLVYDGFAHGSTWNGFDNVAVTREVLDKIIADMCGPFNGDETRELFQAIEPMDNGLYSLGWGFTTTIVEPDPDAPRPPDLGIAFDEYVRAHGLEAALTAIADEIVDEIVAIQLAHKERE